MSSYFWTKEVTHALIEEYRARTCLWKTKSKDYLNRTIRARAYDELLFFLKSADDRLSDLTLTDLKKKIDGLRTTFRREHTKVFTSRQSGLPHDYIYKPTLWYYDMMTFLIDGDNSSMSFSSQDGAQSGESKLDAKDNEGIGYEAIKLEKIDEPQADENAASNTSQSEQMEINRISQYYYENPKYEHVIREEPSSVMNRQHHQEEQSSVMNRQHHQEEQSSVMSRHHHQEEQSSVMSRHHHQEEQRSLNFENYIAQNNHDPTPDSRRPGKRKSNLDDLYFLAEKQLRLFDDSEAIFGQNVAINLRKITNSTQRIVCEKLINDALYQARLGTLTLHSFIGVSEDNRMK